MVIVRNLTNSECYGSDQLINDVSLDIFLNCTIGVLGVLVGLQLQRILIRIEGTEYMCTSSYKIRNSIQLV